VWSRSPRIDDGSRLALDDIEERILAQAPVADLSIGPTFANQPEYLRCESVCFDALAGAPAEYAAALSCRGDSGADPLAQQIPVELG
jgi:hypothetical protein